MSWRLRWQIYEYIRNSLWIVPGLFVAVAIAMGFVLPQLDERTSFRIGLSFGSGAAESVLGALAGGMITFTGFVFSILLLAVQFGSSQFSPRMLRRFLRSRTTKVSLGVFMATFVYALMVLRTVGRSNDPNFVPDISITIALWWLLASMVMFLLLITTTTQGLRVASVVRDVGDDGARVIEQVYPDTDKETPGTDLEPSGAVSRCVDFGGRAGILQSVDVGGLVRLARDADVVVELVPAIGDPLTADGLLFRIYGDGAVDDERLRRSIAVGDERTMRQDPAFALRLLADISSKALSPGINDPTTAVQAIDQIEILLRSLGRRRLTPGGLRDDNGQIRLRYPARTWEDLLSLALDEARNFGATSAQVTRRLHAVLDDLHSLVPPERRPAVEAQLDLLHATVRRVNDDPAEQHIAWQADRQGLGTSRPTATQVQVASEAMSEPPAVTP